MATCHKNEQKIKEPAVCIESCENLRQLCGCVVIKLWKIGLVAAFLKTGGPFFLSKVQNTPRNIMESVGIFIDVYRFLSQYYNLFKM